MNPLSQNILDAIELAVKAQTNGPVPLDQIRNGYMEDAENMLSLGMSESRVVSEFESIANDNPPNLT